jgi:hypothetical protein
LRWSSDVFSSQPGGCSARLGTEFRNAFYCPCVTSTLSMQKGEDASMRTMTAPVVGQPVSPIPASLPPSIVDGICGPPSRPVSGDDESAAPNATQAVAAAPKVHDVQRRTLAIARVENNSRVFALEVGFEVHLGGASTRSGKNTAWA